jgi:hypothetical protein
MRKVWAFLKLEWKWLQVTRNRKRLYKSLKVLAPVLVVLGFFTQDQVSHILEIVSAVLLFGGSTVADRNANDSLDG